jgi:hypothetical protein
MRLRFRRIAMGEILDQPHVAVDELLDRGDGEQAWVELAVLLTWVALDVVELDAGLTCPNKDKGKLDPRRTCNNS